MKNLDLNACGVTELKELSYNEMLTLEGGSLWSDICDVAGAAYDVIKALVINDFVAGWNSVNCACY